MERQEQRREGGAGLGPVCWENAGAGDSSAHLWDIAESGVQVGKEGSGLCRGSRRHTEPSYEQRPLQFTKHWSFHVDRLYSSFHYSSWK